MLKALPGAGFRRRANRRQWIQRAVRRRSVLRSFPNGHRFRLVFKLSRIQQVMAFRLLSFYFFIWLIYAYSIQSLPLSDDFPADNYADSRLENMPHLVVHPLQVIALICHQRERYPSQLTRQLCSGDARSFVPQADADNGGDQQQRGKRVGWTISV